MDKQFTLKEALQVQADQLKEWKSILKPEKYKLLETYALKNNKGKVSPYHIFRGTDISNWVANNLIERV